MYYVRSKAYDMHILINPKSPSTSNATLTGQAKETACFNSSSAPYTRNKIKNKIRKSYINEGLSDLILSCLCRVNDNATLQLSL